jgi:fatty-acyl-CoA synthase
MNNNNLYDCSSLGDLLITAIQRGGDKIAFIIDDRSLTYRQFSELLSTFIQALEARGLKKGDVVATLSSNRPEASLVTSAGWIMGLCVVSLNPTSSEDDQAYMLEDSGAKTLFVDPENFSERARSLKQRVSSLDRIFGLGANELGEDILAAAAGLPVQKLVPKADADDICSMIYTGGTTGKPKGIVHTHRVQVTMVSMELLDWEWPAEIRFLALTPITHAAGCAILPTLLRSGTFVMTKTFEPEKFFNLVEKHRITVTFLVPTMLYVLLDHPKLAAANLKSIELILYGAAPMAPHRLVEGLRIFGPVFMQLYGQSEAPMALTVLRKQDHDPERYPQRLASCGTPVIGNKIRLLDESGREVPDGEVGEICVRSPLVMQGYWNKPEETAHTFRNGWLYTGDLARRDGDGFFYIVDRSKDLIITGGFNVFPREVEDILTRHPAVANAAVIGVPDPKWGEAVRGVVMLRPGMSVGAEELIHLVKQQKGAVYAPKRIDFVDTLPLTNLGKLDKKAIRLRYAS